MKLWYPWYVQTLGKERRCGSDSYNETKVSCHGTSENMSINCRCLPYQKNQLVESSQFDEMNEQLTFHTLQFEPKKLKPKGAREVDTYALRGK